jgi:hypothetical protein
MQLNLTDYEAQLLEQRLRGRTVSFSDRDHGLIQGIADRLLQSEVRPDSTTWLYSTGDPDPLKSQEGRRFHLMNMPEPHIHRRETDEYACSCGARWDVSEEHP